MKKLFVSIVLFFTAFIFTGCNPTVSVNNPTDVMEASPTAQTLYQEGDTPFQLFFDSFDRLKTVDEVMNGDPEALEAYYEENIDYLNCASAAQAMLMFQDFKTVRIPYSDNGAYSLEFLDFSSLHRGSSVWYYKEHFQYKFSIINDTEFWGTEEEIEEFYRTKEVVYRQQDDDHIMLVRENDEAESEEILYVGNVFFEDVQIVFTIERARDENGQWEDGGNADVDLNGLADFDFITVGEILESME